jgi:hypothetical protein
VRRFFISAEDRSTFAIIAQALGLSLPDYVRQLARESGLGRVTAGEISAALAPPTDEELRGRYTRALLTSMRQGLRR